MKSSLFLLDEEKANISLNHITFAVDKHAGRTTSSYSLKNRKMRRINGQRSLSFLLSTVLILTTNACTSSNGNAEVLTMLDKELYGEIIKSSNHSNVLFSPYGIVSVLKPMVSMLDKDKQQAVMKRLGISHFEELKCSLGMNEGGDEFHEATRIWVDEGVEMDQESRGLIKKIKMVNHQGSALKTINKWVSKHTLGMIKDLLTSDSILADTKLVVTNALAFQGKWKYPFKVEHTEMRDFKLTQNKKTQVATIATEMKTRYYRGAEGEVAELPYAGDRFSMFIVIPTDIGKSISHDTIKKIIRHKMKKHVKLQVFLPKFKLTTKYALINHLRNIGLGSLFSRAVAIRNADVSFVDILHKVALVVNEEGTKASAGSAGVTSRSFPMRFRVDQPFEFLIQDLTTHQTIFHGKVEKPELE